MEGLVNIFNNKIESWVKYLDINKIDNLQDEQVYKCKECETKISKKRDFIRHIENQHSFVKPPTNSKVYNCFIEIYNYFLLKKYNEQKLIDIYKFILNKIDIQFYDCNDPVYVSRIFDWENNRGKSVETLDIIKNPILVRIPDNKKVEIYEKWEELKHKTHNIYKTNFGQKIFDIAIQIYNKVINRQINHDELFKPIINNNNTYQEMIIFFEIIENLFIIMEKISNDKFGRLINNTVRICINWEAYMWCLLPIFYYTDNIDTKLLKLICKWYFRNLQFKNTNFNNLCYSNDFIEITNKVLKNKSYDYYTDIEKCLNKNHDTSIDEDNYKTSLKSMNFRSTNATYLLLFLETCYSTDLQTVSLDYTLEHIYCQKLKDNLSNQSLMDNIGNLTLIEGKNSENGHTGNFSLGSKEYEKKKKSYKNSGCKITRDVEQNYETFEEKNIIERNSKLIEKLEKYTSYKKISPKE